ncbi:hypothetical protein BGZ79_008546 [Entomortierella chlamydospora]|nr:hypothetical protein BGZ79_008546 [Entomortierella chlamydospora]
MQEQQPRSPVQLQAQGQIQEQTETAAQSKSHSFIVVNGADDRDAGIYSDNFYSQRMSPLRSALRRKMLPWVRSETKDLAALQTDIMGGTVIGVVVWAVQWIFRDSIDALMTEPSWKGNKLVIAMVVLGGIFLILSIPETMDSCPCVDDGVTTLAVIMGIFPASQHFALSKYAISEGGYNGIVHYDPALGLPRSILRFVFGLAVVFTWRMAAKKLLYIVLPPLYGYFNLPSRTHFVPAKTYGNLLRQPIGRVPSVLDLSALADSSIEIVGPQSTMDIHEQFSQTRSSKRLSVHGPIDDYNIETKERFGLRPSYASKARQEQKDQEGLKTGAAAPVEYMDGDSVYSEKELDESERIAMEKFEAEHPGWARFDVDIVIKTVVYAGIGWLTIDSIPIMFEYIGLGHQHQQQQQQQQQLQIPTANRNSPHSQNTGVNTNPPSRRNSISLPSSAYRYHYHQHQGVNEGGPSPTGSVSSSNSKHHSYMQVDNVGITLEEYEEVLNSEVWIEVSKLREYARHGIPYEVRGRVWVYLLGIKGADLSNEVSTQKQRMQEFEQMDKEPDESSKRVRGEITRYLRKIKIESSRDIPRLFEEYISAFCNQNRQVEYYPAMVNLCAPFVYSVKCEWDAYMCFEKIINMLDDHFNEQSINEAVAKFMTLFHTCIPDLYSYFEEEEVNIKEWAASALRYLLSRELPLECTMRLWDTYFAIPDSDWISFHPYACLAILKSLKEGFEDLEQSEIRTVLMRLPKLDMDRYIQLMPVIVSRCKRMSSVSLVIIPCLVISPSGPLLEACAIGSYKIVTVKTYMERLIQSLDATFFGSPV